jgi:phosphoesterase RecJ-like protein
MDRDTALVLYTGIMTDTGSFRYSNTSSFTFSAASELLKFGIDTASIYRYTYENIPALDVKLLLKLLSGIQFFSRGRLAVFQIDLKSSGIKKTSIDLAEQLLSFGRSIKGVEVVVLFKDNSGPGSMVRVNLRSQGKVDVNKIAQSFGGGGHRTAAGVTLSGDFEAIRRKVIARILSGFKK